LLVIVVLFGLIYSLPNIFDQDPALEISGSRRAQVDVALESKIKDTLKSADLEIKSSEMANKKLLLRFKDSETQLRAKEALTEVLQDGLTLAPTLSADVPD